MPDTSTKTGSPLTIIISWAVVVIPAAWGVYNTALGAAKLFQ